MNHHDLNNLNYILNLSANEMQTWLDAQTPDDLHYAWEIIRSRTAEMIVEEMDLDELEDTDLTQANTLINRIKNKV
jgi:hypothetical protein